MSIGADRKRSATRGALVGGAAGLALIAYPLRSDTTAAGQRRGNVRVALPVAAGLVLIGTGLGALGALVAPERWDVARTVARHVSSPACWLPRVGLQVRF